MTTEITLLGGFVVTRDGIDRPDEGWRRRQAAALVKMLALAPGRRMHREQVIDALWPDQTLDEAGPRLHKAAFYARKALGDPEGVLLRADNVELLPGQDVVVDAVEFEAAAGAALRDGGGDRDALADALARCAGDLLPADPYDEWLELTRERISQLRLELLRRLERWDEVVAIEPTDEAAHLALMRRAAGSGDHHAALRQFERLERVLSTELGVGPSAEIVRMRNDLVLQASRPEDSELIGRTDAQARLRTALLEASTGRGRAVLIQGVAGVGKTAVLDWLTAEAIGGGWRTGRGSADSVAGGWAYAPVLEALADLCRRQPTLLDGLDDAYRDEIDRALTGSDLDWSGEGGHQRLFVATAELLRLAAADRGLVLIVDDLHDADDASLRLVHYLARCATTERVVLVAAHRPPSRDTAFAEMRTRFVGRAGTSIELEALDDEAALALIKATSPAIDDEQARRVISLAAGLPFALTELSAREGAGAAWERSLDHVLLGGLDSTTRESLQEVAVLGTTFDTDELVAVTGLPDDEAFALLDRAIEARLVEHTGAHYRFRHALVRDALVADIAPHRRRRIHRSAADGLISLDASAARIGHHLVEAGEPATAAPYLLRAAEREAAIGAYRDALDLVEAVLGHVDDEQRGHAFALRADLLFALGDPDATVAYRQALSHADEARSRLLRARLVRAATVAGDLPTAVAALDGLELDGGDADADILLARAYVCFFQGRLEDARDTATEARRRVMGGERSWQVLELVGLEALLAHSRGEWFDRIRSELRTASRDPELTLAIFDGYLCTAEYLLYGATPFAEVAATAAALRDTAQRAGALRAVAFAGALAGEAQLLAGDLDAAETALTEAAELHRDLGARAGEAHCLQRLAEVSLAQGDAERATDLLHRALPLARWSLISMHLLQRIFGTMIRAAPDADAARSIVDRAESTLGTEDQCVFCAVMLAVPAAIACAHVGDLEGADRHLTVAELSSQMWDGTSWDAALLEAKAEVADARGDHGEAERLLADATALFERSGQPLDADRCRARVVA